MSEVCGDFLRRGGMNLDYVSTDWGTVTQRILKQDPVPQGGWNMMAMVFTLVLVVITMSGSMWVMYHLNTNMMPMPVNMNSMP